MFSWVDRVEFSSSFYRYVLRFSFTRILFKSISLLQSLRPRCPGARAECYAIASIPLHPPSPRTDHPRESDWSLLHYNWHLNGKKALYLPVSLSFAKINSPRPCPQPHSPATPRTLTTGLLFYGLMDDSLWYLCTCTPKFSFNLLINLFLRRGAAESVRAMRFSFSSDRSGLFLSPSTGERSKEIRCSIFLSLCNAFVSPFSFLFVCFPSLRLFFSFLLRSHTYDSYDCLRHRRYSC